MTGLHVALPDELVEAVARRAAELLLELQPPPAVSPFLSIDEAAAYLRCSRQRIYDLRSSGRLSRLGDGSRALVARAELDALVGLAQALPMGRRGRMAARGGG